MFLKGQALFRLIRNYNFTKKFPFAVSWHVTDHCNACCHYCDHRFRKTEDLPTADMIKILNSLQLARIKMVMFSGGEPLLRQDLDQLVSLAKSLGMFVAVSTNGSLLKKRIELMKQFNFIKISLDGDLDTHDGIRGSGSFAHVLSAIELCKSFKIPLRLSSVICNENALKLQPITDLARYYKVKVKFQPASNIHTRANVSDPLKLISLENFKHAYQFLSGERKNNKYIVNSPRSLAYYNSAVANNNQLHVFKCRSTLLTTIISSDGFLSPCVPLMNHIRIDCRGRDANKIVDAFNEVHLKMDGVLQNCRKCWCLNGLELNSFLSHPSNLLTVINKVFSV
ncbi:MAG: radical SAM protein [Oligoflexia bacterium]|nr:radical SAM protein [Oligoflexia bacterium]